MKSLLDRTFKNGEQYNIPVDIPFYFLYEKDSRIEYSKLSSELWFTELYYYSKSFSGLNEWCEYFFEEVYHYLNDGFKIESHHPQLLSNLFSWSSENFDSKKSRAIRKLIEREYSNISWNSSEANNEIKATLGIQLLLVIDYKNIEKSLLFEEIERHFTFHTSHRMQALIALCYDEEHISFNISNLIFSIKDYNSYLKSDTSNIIQKIYLKARLFKIFNNIICTSAEKGKTDIIEEILIAYYDISIPQRFGRTLFIIPNMLKKVVYAFNNKVLIDEKDSQSLMIKVIDIENKAFNTFNVLKGGQNQSFTYSEKSNGFPNNKDGELYENALFELFNFRLLRDYLSDFDSICLFSMNLVPLQALMIKSIGTTLPINLSLSKKLEYNKLDRVLGWSGNSHTSSLEVDVLVHIFQNNKIEFEVHNENDSNLNDFLLAINDKNPDVIWISSHGEFGHYEPNKSYIIFSDSEKLAIRDFDRLTNNSKNRRLLYLNICEGGAHTQTGEFKNLGFPNLLTSFNQDVLSNLWMTEPIPAYVFGTIFAKNLMKNRNDYFQAYKYTMTQFLGNKQSILEVLKEDSKLFGQVIERIENNNSIEWDNLITTGSLAYFI